MAREKRRVEWERLMFRTAWKIEELTPKLGLSYRATRRLVQRAYEGRRLDRTRDGRYFYFVVARFLHPPNSVIVCPTCSAQMEVYECKCGCIFKMCTAVDEHSIFEYCRTHIIVT